jgi:hypothetical protein
VSRRTFVKPAEAPIIGTSSRALLDSLRSLRGTFGRDAEARKFHLLRALLSGSLRRGRDIAQLHDELLFATGFPDSARIRAIAHAALTTFAARARRLTAAERRKLADSGIAGTLTTYAFMYGVARWLMKYREHVAIDWRAMTEPERLDPLLCLSLSPVEIDAFDSGEFSTPEWVELASGQPHAQALPWLLGAAPERATTAINRNWRDSYDAGDVKIAWELRASPRSVSGNRAPVTRVTMRRAFRAPPPDVASHVVTPLIGIRRLRRPTAARWHDACVAALAARGREVLPTVYANLDEIYLAPLGDGVELCVLGVAPEDRLALEANYGYVMFANGVPMGYGGVTVLGAQANTGVNIFASFRHSEAAYLFAQVLRVFRTLFGATRFLVNPSQLGANNDEALESGAYWFYHRLGFRPLNVKVAALAEEEHARNTNRRGRRSSLATLRRLASSDVMLELPDAAETVLFDERWLFALSCAVAEHLAPHAAGARQAYVEALSRELRVRLTGERRRLRADERAGAVYLVPVIALLQNEVARWPSADRAALWELVRLKGQLRERRFAQASRAHGRLWRTLADYCRRRAPAAR